MDLDASDKDFSAELERWLAQLSDDTLQSFERVLADSPGYYPTTLHDGWLLEIERRGLEPEDSTLNLADLVQLPVGHALDFDWRFAEQTRRRLLAELELLTKAGDLIAYVGTPTLFVESIDGLRDRERILFDSNEVMIEDLQKRLGTAAARYLRIGVDSDPIDVHAQLCVLDPPWYPDDTRDFLEAAAALVSVGDPILISQPPLSARPGVAAERAVLAGDLPLLGLRLEGIATGFLAYQTPHFERMSLMSAAPTLRIPEVWRRGDLFYLRKIGAGEERTSMRRAQEEWTEVRFGPVRIRLRDVGGDHLGLVAPDLDRLLTVSRRDPLRRRVGFWTSGNRVRTCGEVEPIAKLIALCDSSLTMLQFTHRTVLDHAEQIGVETRVAHELAELLLLEYQEHIAGGFGVVE